MKKVTYVFCVILLLLTSADNGAQTYCVTCPKSDSLKVDSSVSQIVRPFKDSLYKKFNEWNTKQDSVMRHIRKLAIKRKWVRTEYYILDRCRWRYDWHYVGENFTELKKHRL